MENKWIEDNFQFICYFIGKTIIGVCVEAAWFIMKLHYLVKWTFSRIKWSLSCTKLLIESYMQNYELIYLFVNINNLWSIV